MFSNLLISKFIKDYKNTNDKNVRTGYAYLGGIIGIILNFTLFIVKLSVGLLVNSLSVTADAFNNLSDAAASVITILGFKLAAKPADKEHPFGHGRMEYISALVVSFMILLVGFQFVKSSFDRILHPSHLSFSFIPFVLILLSVCAKIWISRFNKKLGNAINSTSLKASSVDALTDVVASSCVALSMLASKWTNFPIDGYIGLLVAILIIYAGYSIIKDTLNPLLGEAPDPELVKAITKEVLSFEYISGVHDLIIHNYGPGRAMASIHAEVPCNVPILKIHEIIDAAEKQVSKDCNIYLVIHMDPINTDSKETAIEKNNMEKILTAFPAIKSFHDFRVVGEGEHKNLIFDIVIDSSVIMNSKEEESLINEIQQEIRVIHEFYNVVITIDKDFSIY